MFVAVSKFAVLTRRSYPTADTQAGGTPAQMHPIDVYKRCTDKTLLHGLTSWIFAMTFNYIEAHFYVCFRHSTSISILTR